MVRVGAADALKIRRLAGSEAGNGSVASEELGKGSDRATGQAARGPDVMVQNERIGSLT
jgi:hypothetical protein